MVFEFVFMIVFEKCDLELVVKFDVVVGWILSWLQVVCVWYC